MKKFILLLTVVFPWRVKYFILTKIFKYDIHHTARIGFSIIIVKHLKMGPGSRIGNLNIIKVEYVELGRSSSIGRLNYITGFPLYSVSGHFSAQPERKPMLLVGEHSAITSRHLIDCTDLVRIGRFSTFAGFRSQILTHSINIERSRQEAYPVLIGDYCFVGTDSVLLGGASLPDYSVLGAKSLLNSVLHEPYCLYGGVPARRIKALDRDSRYFRRAVGFIV